MRKKLRKTSKYLLRYLLLDGAAKTSVSLLLRHFQLEKYVFIIVCIEQYHTLHTV